MPLTNPERHLLEQALVHALHSGDPLPSNPFPFDVPAHHLWNAATIQAASNLRGFLAALVDTIETASVQTSFCQIIETQFDVWANRAATVVGGTVDLDWYRRSLMETARQLRDGWETPTVSGALDVEFPPQAVAQTLRDRLLHWMNMQPASGK